MTYDEFAERLPSLFATGILSGMWEGVKILAPYVAIVIAYYIIRIIIKQYKKRKKDK